MGRPSLVTEKKAAWVPVIARAFAELGYRRATTAELARRLEVQENLLYRIWPDKRAMFVAAIDFVFENSARTWRKLLERSGTQSAARLLLKYEAEHHGEFGLYRILFAGLNEADDPAIGTALRRTYQRFVQMLAREIAEHWRTGGRTLREDGSERVTRPTAGAPEVDVVAIQAGAAAEQVAWAFIGLGTAANIGRELGLLDGSQRARLLECVGGSLLESAPRA